MDEQLHSPARRLIELRIAHAELDGRIDALMGVLRADTVVDFGPLSTTTALTAMPTMVGEVVGELAAPPVDELTLRRLKKQRLALRDEIARLERASDPDEPA
jgi:hypothetical protein